MKELKLLFGRIVNAMFNLRDNRAFNGFFNAFLFVVLITVMSVEAGLFPPIGALPSKSRSSDDINSYSKKYFKSINQIIKLNDTSRINEDILKRTFNYHDRISGRQLSEYGYVNALEDCIVLLTLDTTKQNSIILEHTLKLIDKELITEPFSDLPPDQKQLLINIDDNISKINIDEDQKKIIFYNIKELSRSLKLRNDYLEKIENENRTSYALSIISVILTGFFGILSINWVGLKVFNFLKSLMSYRKEESLEKESGK